MPIIVAGQSKAMILFPGLFYSGLCPVYTFRQPTLNRFTLFEHWMNFIQGTLYRPWPKLNFTLFEHWMNLHPEYNCTGHWPNPISQYLKSGWTSSTVHCTGQFTARGLRRRASGHGPNSNFTLFNSVSTFIQKILCPAHGSNSVPHHLKNGWTSSNSVTICE